jgi:hypothetical protein
VVGAEVVFIEGWGVGTNDGTGEGSDVGMSVGSRVVFEEGTDDGGIVIVGVG